MPSRIAPRGEHSIHFLTISHLRQFADALDALNRGEGDGTLLLSLCREWLTCRRELEGCRRHSAIIRLMDAIKLDVEALWSYPPPAEMKISETNINMLRQLIKPLWNCKESFEIKY